MTIDWDKATVKITVPVHHTAMTDVQEVELPLSVLTERFSRLEAALAGAVTALELVIDGETTMSAEEVVERLLYPEHFGQAETMLGKKAWERINLARGTS